MTLIAASRFACPCGNSSCPAYVREALPIFVGHIAQQMQASGALSVVVSFPREHREAPVLGSVCRRRLETYRRFLDERHINTPHAIASVELSADRRLNVHMLIRGVKLKKRSLRGDWSRLDAQDADFEEVTHPLELASYIFKTPLLGILEGEAAEREILQFVRDLHAGSYGYRINSFLDQRLVKDFEDLSTEIMRYVRRKRDDWLADKMPQDVTDSVRGAVRLTSERLDEIAREFSL